MITQFKWLALLCMLAACNRSETGAAAPASGPSSATAATSAPGSAPATSGKGPGQAAVSVNTVVARLQDVPVQLQANANVQALSSVELHPQLVATVEKVHVKEGDFVKAGQVLFTLNAATENANLAKARAQLARDQVLLQDLERQFKRSQELVAQKFVTQSNADTVGSSLQAQKALLASDQAAVHAAEVALGFGRITSPMNGRVGEIRVFAGSLVQASTTLLTVTQLQPIALSFSLPEADLPALLAAHKAGAVAVSARGGAAKGQLSFIDNAIDQQSGMIRVKAQFDNQDGQWWPGQYAEVQLTVNTLKNVVVVPQAAIITSTKGRFVYTMELDGSAKSIPVTPVYSFGQQAVVSGLAGGEKVILEGKQNLRPGNKVVEGGKDRKGAAGEGTKSARGAKGASANGADAASTSNGKGGA
jgi:RND family efflux transporter MFP subunit